MESSCRSTASTPSRTGPAACSFALRFVEVPPDCTRGFQHGDVLPLFQMIGKNVGIRRARGRFVLATNIDIVFSNELVEFLSRRELSAGQLYRVDRHDIEPQFPVTGSLSEQDSDYCKSHQLRLHSRDGTHPVDRYGRVKPLADDIVDGVVVTLGGGWHVREGDDRFGHYRWGGDKAELTVNRAAAPGLERGAILSLEFEPNAYQPASSIDIEILDRGRLLARRIFSSWPDGTGSSCMATHSSRCIR